MTEQKPQTDGSTPLAGMSGPVVDPLAHLAPPEGAKPESEPVGSGSGGAPVDSIEALLKRTGLDQENPQGVAGPALEDKPVLPEQEPEDKLAAEWAMMEQKRQGGEVPDFDLDMDAIDSLLGFEPTPRPPSLKKEIRELRNKFRMRRAVLREVGLTEKTALVRQAEVDRMFHGLNFLFDGKPKLSRDTKGKVFTRVCELLKDSVGKEARSKFPFVPVVICTVPQNLEFEHARALEILRIDKLSKAVMFVLVHSLEGQKLPKYAVNLWQRVGSAWLNRQMSLEVVSHDYLD